MPTKNEHKLLWDHIRTENDLKSFECLHHLYYAKLCDFSFSLLKERSACEEVVSDVFVTIWGKRKELEHVNNILSFLYTCTKNLSIDLLRKNNRAIDLESIFFEIEDLTHSHNFFSEYDMVKFREHLQKAVDELPAQCKLIFKMVLNDHLNCSEIAEILNLSKKTIETQVSIAYKKLTVILKKVYKKDLDLCF